MLRILFLIFVLMNSAVLVQAQENLIGNEIPTAVKIEEFGNEPSGYIKMLTDNYFIKLENEPTSQGYIITYGPNKPIARRETFLRNYILMRRFNEQRVKFVTGGFSKELKTEFWIVPEGAEPPKISKSAKLTPLKAVKFEEFGYVSNGNIRHFMDKFFQELINNRDFKGFIINYGKPNEIIQREKVLRNRINLRNLTALRIKFVRGGNKKGFITELWFVPPGAEPPTAEK